MSDTKVETKTDAGLVSITFTNGRSEQVTREVYPEIAKWQNSRVEAQQAYEVAVRLARRVRQQYLWDKEDEWYRDPANRPNTFDEYVVGRQYDRDTSRSDDPETLRNLEHKYTDFINVGARRPNGRHNVDNPNSWAILHEEAQAAGHKTITWIIDNCMDNEHEATIILRYLPAAVEELWEIAKDDHEMCQVFDRYMERAEAAGVLQTGDVPEALRERRAIRSYLRRVHGTGYIREIMEHVDRIARVEREAAVATARAEWQQLDAAREENIRRNRSEGARRAAETPRRNAEAAQSVIQAPSDATGASARVEEKISA